ncbi:GNAT family N-acetyltransferase [Rhodocytophaga rosea]|uniref:GNAT family N-acetyltransferase n=1 Tax=Rhodocytophaga rosea TaxID=2704465 RepID=A0A6C0GG94_9BACT|nr:GNAT family N-acetyltransferase [Rhodocytophaga rosea]QHT66700.1 GNAT family N-acetyltransferase [Rhodocytophaga rosea]
MITVKHISLPEELKQAFSIRENVFVQEQQVPAEEEYDEFEDSSHHFLAFAGENPCGTARWRYTDKGIKLERFAVLEEYRSRKVGSALVKTVINDIRKDGRSKGKMLYLHAQLTAMPLYSKFGFQPVGDMFEECNIKHYKMVLKSE